MTKKYEFTLNLKLKDLKFKHQLADLFPNGEELTFKSGVISNVDTALDAVQGFAEDVKTQLCTQSGFNLTVQVEPNPGTVKSSTGITWQDNEVLKVWVLNTNTNQPYALAQLMEIE